MKCVDFTFKITSKNDFVRLYKCEYKLNRTNSCSLTQLCSFLTHTAPSKKVPKASEASSKQKDPVVVAPAATSVNKEKNGEEQSKKTATSLILFEEVDVIFDDDSGFLAAIKTFMTTTKRPVILTTSGKQELEGSRTLPVTLCVVFALSALNVWSQFSLVCFLDPTFSTMFDGNFEEIHFKTPSAVSHDQIIIGQLGMLTK